LKSIRFLLTVRKLLSFFGEGRLERLCAALILFTPSFFLTFWLCLLAKFPSAWAIGVSSVVVMFLMWITAMLVLGTPDAELEGETRELKRELPKLRQRIEDLQKCWDEDHHKAQIVIREEKAERRAEAAARLAAEEARRAAREAKRRAEAAAREAKRPRLAECPDCGAMVSVRALTCPKCGCPFKDEKRPRRVVEDSRRCPECGSREWDWQTRVTQGGIALCIVLAMFCATLPLCWIPLIAMRERFRVCASCREEL
jgi:hypothetical protein